MRDLALGRMKAGTMNKTESAYALELERQRQAGEIQWYRFEGVKLRLGDNTFLTVDFVVMAADGVLEMREVKGFYRDDAKVKMKVAADQYPFRFYIVRKRSKRDGGGWEVETV